LKESLTDAVVKLSRPFAMSHARVGGIAASAGLTFLASRAIPPLVCCAF
jgi:hypothetical protein